MSYIIVKNEKGNTTLELKTHSNGSLQEDIKETTNLLLDIFLNKETFRLNIVNEVEKVVMSLLVNGCKFSYDELYNDELIYTIDVEHNSITNNVGAGFMGIVEYLKEHDLVTDIEKGQIKAIHTLVNKLNWSDDKYRDVLEVLFDVCSCKELDTLQASILIDMLSKFNTYQY